MGVVVGSGFVFNFSCILALNSVFYVELLVDGGAVIFRCSQFGCKGERFL